MVERRNRIYGGIKFRSVPAALAVTAASAGLIVGSLATAASLASVSAAPGSRSAPMAYLGSDGRIAFVRNGNIFSIKPNGSGLRKLTHQGHAASPRWSPNGARLAFIYRGNLWIMKANGTGKTQVTDAAPRYTDGRPTWSPDGRYLAFIKTLRHRSYGYLTRYDTVRHRFVSFTDTINAHVVNVAALASSAVAWQRARDAGGQNFGFFIIYEGARQQCIGERYCLNALGFAKEWQYRNGFPSATIDHSAPIRQTDPDWYPILPSFATDILTTVENCAITPCAHSGLSLRIGSATILPGAYEGVYAPVGDRIAYARNVRGKPAIYTLEVSPVAEFNPVFLTYGTEPDWQPTAPFPPH
jgi:hypothetical protein